MTKNERAFRQGDLVMIELPEGNFKVFKLRTGGMTQTKYGLIRHDDVIGKLEGTVVRTSTGSQVLAFRPSIFDLQLNYCERTTQVIYPKDSSYIVEYNEIKSGDRVFEAGVGSGFLTMLLACRVAPDGVVYGFDVNPRALTITRRNLELTGCEKNVVLANHDVKTGIPLTDMDAGFLDIPDPWNVIEHAWKALAPGGKLTIFIPTINQLAKVLKSLKESKYGAIRAAELQYRELETSPDAVRPKSVQVVHTGYIVFARKTL